MRMLAGRLSQKERLSLMTVNNRRFAVFRSESEGLETRTSKHVPPKSMRNMHGSPEDTASDRDG
jgi:hypothetical protein